MPSAPLNIDAAIKSCDPELLDFLFPTLDYLFIGKESDDSRLTCDVTPRKVSIKLTRTDGTVFVVTVEKRGN